jgi:aspartate/methionine/tyrosine aminotransferase
VGPARAVSGTRKMTNHTVYNVPRPMQAAAMAAIVNGDSMGRERSPSCISRIATWPIELVTAPCARPDGATYLFLDLSGYCRRR